MIFRAAIAATFLLVFPLKFEAAQVDWLFPIGSQRGSEALAQIGGKYEWPLKTWSNDAGIRFVADEKKKGFFKVTIQEDVVPGPYLVRFYDANGTTPPRVFFVGKAPDVPEKEPNNEMLSPQIVETLPAIVHGKLQSGGDVDSYRVRLKAGQVLVANLDAYTAGISMDALMMLRDTRGVKLAFNHDAHSLDPRLTWKCDRDGEYVLQIAAFKFPANSTSSFSGGADHVYRLTLTNGPYLRHVQPMSDGRVTLVGWNLKKKTLSVPKPINGELRFDAAAVNGPLCLPISNASNQLEKEPNDTNASAQDVFLPSIISGQVAKPDDIDRFAFTVKKGERHQFDLESFRLGFLLDGRLSIEDSSGKELASNDDSNKKRDPQLIWTAPVDGRYCAVVRSLLRKGGNEYYYRLHIRTPKPTFAATVPAPHFTVNAGATNEVKIAIKFSNSYKGKLELRAKSLPKGITAKPIEVTKAGEAKFMLVAAIDAKSVNLPLALELAEVDGEIVVPVQCKLTSASTVNGVPQGFPDFIIPISPHLWLTVLPPKPPEKPKPKDKKSK